MFSSHVFLFRNCCSRSSSANRPKSNEKEREKRQHFRIDKIVGVVISMPSQDDVMNLKFPPFRSHRPTDTKNLRQSFHDENHVLVFSRSPRIVYSNANDKQQQKKAKEK